MYCTIQWRNKGARRPQKEATFLGAESLWGRRKVSTMSQVRSSIQYICFQKTLDSNMWRQTCSMPRAPSNLVTIRHTLNLSHEIVWKNRSLWILNRSAIKAVLWVVIRGESKPKRRSGKRIIAGTAFRLEFLVGWYYDVGATMAVPELY